MRLRTALALGFAAVATSVALTLGVATWTATASRLRQETDRSLAGAAEELLTAFRENGIAAIADEPAPRDGGGDPGPGPGRGRGRDRGGEARTLLPAQFITADGTVTALTPSSTEFRVTADDIAIAGDAESRRLLTDVTVGGDRLRLLTWGAGGGRGAVQVGRDTSENAAVLGALAAQIAGIGALVALLAAGAGVLLAGRLTRRLEQLGAATQEVARTGSFDVVVPAQGTDEVARLGGIFNEMLSTLARLRAQQERLLADAGHELRTPLTSLRTNISLLERFSDLSPAARGQVVEDLRSESRELSTLVEEVLTLARGTTDAAPHEPVRVADVVSSVVERARRRTGRTIKLAGSETGRAGVVLGDRAALQRAVRNLVDNAVKFDPSASPVDVTVDGTPEHVDILVEDRGPGIPDDERDVVLERFHRGETARAVPGSGLGLSIVADVVAAHGGTLTLLARDGGGLRVVLRLPALAI